MQIKITEHLKNQYGTAGIMAVIVMLLVSVIGAGMYNLSHTDLTINNNLSDGVEAQYLAEEGAQYVATELKHQFEEKKGDLYDKVKSLEKGKSTSRKTIDKTVNKSKGSYTYIISWPDDQTNLVMIVTGKVHSAYRTVVRPIIQGYQAFKYGIFGGGGSIMLSANDLVIDWTTGGAADVRATNRINIANGTDLRGSVYAKEIDDQRTGVDSSTVHTRSGKLNDLDDMAKEYRYSEKGTLWTGQNNDQNVKIEKNQTISAGTYHINGELNITSKIELQAESSGPIIIYVKGNCNFEKDAKIKGNFLIISDGTINVKGAELNKTVLVSHGNIILETDSKVTGTVISINGDVNLHEKARVTYDPVLVQQLTGSGG